LKRKLTIFAVKLTKKINNLKLKTVYKNLRTRSDRFWSLKVFSNIFLGFKKEKKGNGGFFIYLAGKTKKLAGK
jgi:hypothetical protein